MSARSARCDRTDAQEDSAHSAMPRFLRLRLLVALAASMAKKKPPGEDFMRDPLIDAEPEYSVEELKRFRAGET